MIKRLAVINQAVCAACGACLNSCPKKAISIYRGCYATADTSQCIGCGLCAKNCPAGCIDIRERSETL